MGTRAAGFCLFFVGAFQEIIHADPVEIRQRAQYAGRDHPLAALVVGIGPLRHIDRRAHLCLHIKFLFSIDIKQYA